MLKFVQGTGRLEDSRGELIGFGFAGQREGYNNPDKQNVPDIGPLPRGFYKIGAPYHHPHLGPLTMDLTPFPENQMFGRSLFRIHGRSAINPELSSKGCVCQDRPARQFVADHLNQDDVVEVVR